MTSYRPLPYPATAYSSRREPVEWLREARIALVVGAFVTLLGSVVGVVWHAVASKPALLDVASASEGAMKLLIGEDLWLGLLGVFAGVVSVALLRVVTSSAADGPGAQLGLAVGGLLAMLVAARTGHLIAHDSLAAALRSKYPDADPSVVTYLAKLFAFKLRMKAVLLSWPFAAVLLNAFIVGVRPPNQAARVLVSAYSGSS